MVIRATGPRRFRRRPEPKSDSAHALALAGARVAERFALDCGTGPLDRVPAALAPAPGERRQGVDAGAARSRSIPRSIVAGFAWFLLAAHIFWIGTTSLLVFSYKFIQPSATVLMAWRSWADGWKIRAPRPIPLRSVPVWFRSMLISVEDYRFYEHHGFDFQAIKRAYEIDRRLDEPMYGGSTLTMQVARTLFLVPAKSYLRKYLEVIVTVELEAILGKDRILELYFDYAEWGKGLFGIEATTHRWYGKDARFLTREEGARLIAILSSPIKYRPEWFGRSLILQERYDYLVRRFLPSLEPVPTAEAQGPLPALPSPPASTLAGPEPAAPSQSEAEPPAAAPLAGQPEPTDEGSAQAQGSVLQAPVLQTPAAPSGAAVDPTHGAPPPAHSP